MQERDEDRADREAIAAARAEGGAAIPIEQLAERLLSEPDAPIPGAYVDHDIRVPFVEAGRSMPDIYDRPSPDEIAAKRRKMHGELLSPEEAAQVRADLGLPAHPAPALEAADAPRVEAERAAPEPSPVPLAPSLPDVVGPALQAAAEVRKHFVPAPPVDVEAVRRRVLLRELLAGREVKALSGADLREIARRLGQEVATDATGNVSAEQVRVALRRVLEGTAPDPST